MSGQQQCQDQVSEEDLEIFLETLKNRGHGSLSILISAELRKHEKFRHFISRVKSDVSSST